MPKGKRKKTEGIANLAKEQSRKGGGGKLSRTEVVTVRLDPKLRFAAELASRKHRRTLSSFIEWAVEKAVKETNIILENGIHLTADEVIQKIWDVDEAERFVKFASLYPSLLTHDEEVLWKFICELQFLWQPTEDLQKDLDVRKDFQSINYEILNWHFEDFKKIVDGKLDKSTLFSILLEGQQRYNERCPF